VYIGLGLLIAGVVKGSPPVQKCQCFHVTYCRRDCTHWTCSLAELFCYCIVLHTPAAAH